MDQETFKLQMTRLESVYGERAYPPERQKLLWRTFSADSNEVFSEAVDYLILTFRTTPMHNEFVDAVTDARTREHQRRQIPIYGSGMSGILDSLIKQTTPEAKEFGKHCTRLVLNKEKYTKTQWEEAMLLIEKTARTVRK